MKQYYVYIITNKQNGTLYTGVTSNLIQRVYQHNKKQVEGFSSKHGIDKLVYFEIHEDINEAIQREKNIKAWKRSWKLELIEEANSNWLDLYEDLS